MSSVLEFQKISLNALPRQKPRNSRPIRRVFQPTIPRRRFDHPPTSLSLHSPNWIGLSLGTLRPSPDRQSSANLAAILGGARLAAAQVRYSNRQLRLDRSSHPRRNG